MLGPIMCQTCFDLVRSVRPPQRCVIEEPKDVVVVEVVVPLLLLLLLQRVPEMYEREEPKDVLLARVFSQSVEFLRQVEVGGLWKGIFTAKFSMDGDDDASSSFHSITMRAERSRMTVGWATSTASLHCTATKKWPGQQKMTVDCQRRDLKSSPSTLPHFHPSTLLPTCPASHPLTAGL